LVTALAGWAARARAAATASPAKLPIFNTLQSLGLRSRLKNPSPPQLRRGRFVSFFMGDFIPFAAFSFCHNDFDSIKTSEWQGAP
jgi:hypothetical protein